MDRATADREAQEALTEAKRRARETMAVHYVQAREGRCVGLTQRPHGPHFRIWPGGRIEHWPDGKPGARQEDANGAGAGDDPTGR